MLSSTKSKAVLADDTTPTTPKVLPRRSYLKDVTKPVEAYYDAAGLKSSVVYTALAFCSFGYTYDECFPSIRLIAKKRRVDRKTIRRHLKLILEAGGMTKTKRTQAMKYTNANRDTTNLYEFNIPGFITQVERSEAAGIARGATIKNVPPSGAICPPVRVSMVKRVITGDEFESCNDDLIDFDFEVGCDEPITASGNNLMPQQAEKPFIDKHDAISHKRARVNPNNPLNSKAKTQSKPTQQERFAVIRASLADYEHKVVNSVVGLIASLWGLSGLSEAIVIEIMGFALAAERVKKNKRNLVPYVRNAINQRAGQYSLTGINADGVCYDNLNRLRKEVEARKKRALPDSTIEQWAKSVLLIDRSIEDQIFIVDHAINEGWDMIRNTEYDA